MLSYNAVAAVGEVGCVVVGGGCCSVIGVRTIAHVVGVAVVVRVLVVAAVVECWKVEPTVGPIYVCLISKAHS